MLRLAQWMSNALTALSLLLCVATAMTWVMNPWCEGQFGRVGREQTAYVLTAHGTVTLYLSITDRSDRVRWLADAWRTPEGDSPEDFQWRTLGFLYALGGTAGGNVARAWTVPDWFVICLLALAPAARLRRWRRARSAARVGRCPSCGYDLRATPDRCPECGRVSPTPEP
jgi:hypothetical protein